MKNRARLSLRVPAPPTRPGDAPDFSGVKLSGAGEVERPDIDASPRDISDLAFKLIRVLDDKGQALGAWNPKLDPARQHPCPGPHKADRARLERPLFPPQGPGCWPLRL